jgi:tight adherence protein B
VSGFLLAAAAVLLWPRPRAVARLRGRRAPVLRAARQADPPDAVLAGAAAALAGVLAGSLLVAALAAVVGAAAARAYRVRRRELRTEELLGRLTDGLAALAADLRSGRPVEVAARAAAEACADEQSGRLLTAALLGSPGADRGGRPGPGGPLQPALDRIAAGAALSTRTGCSLAAVTTAVEEDLRARSRVRRELRTAVAGPLAGARVLAGLPVLGLAMGHGVGADPWRVLTTTGTGQVLLVAGVGLELAGLAWSRAITERAVR